MFESGPPPSCRGLSHRAGNTSLIPATCMPFVNCWKFAGSRRSYMICQIRSCRWWKSNGEMVPQPNNTITMPDVRYSMPRAFLLTKYSPPYRKNNNIAATASFRRSHDHWDAIILWPNYQRTAGTTHDTSCCLTSSTSMQKILFTMLLRCPTSSTIINHSHDPQQHREQRWAQAPSFIISLAQETRWLPRE